MMLIDENFRAMADSSDLCWLVHEVRSKNILWANRNACEAFKYSVEELRALKAHHMSSQDPNYRREMGISWLQMAVVEGSSRKLWKYRDRNGMDFLTEATASIYELEQAGEVLVVKFRILGGTEAPPQPSTWVEETLDRLMRHTSSGILLLNNENQVKDASPLAARLFGHSVADILNKDLNELGVSDVDFDSDEAKYQLMKPEGSMDIRIKVSDRYGTLRWLAGFLDNVVDKDRRFRVLTVRDISEKVEWEKRNAHQMANLQYLSRYNAMGDMAMILAHELGQPLAAATNYLGGVLKRIPDEGTEERPEQRSVSYGIEQAKKQLERASEIVSSVKRYVRRIESATSVFDLNREVEESLYFARLRAEEKGVLILDDLLPDELLIEGESVLIGQVIINICMNALEEVILPTTEEKVMELRTESDGNTVSILVCDQGRGIEGVPADRLAAGAFSSKEDGSGIGLIISEHIVQRHGGHITYEPNQPRGTKVRITLPLVSSKS
ncbi:sensor histidine kinase [Corynebacterium glutamicum]|nr:PAS domain-containing sensor histidine kinase [Corynebacterium glutamicum]